MDPVRRPSAPAVVSFLVVAGVILVTVSQLDPSQLVSTSTITGGDTGAHVALAWFLKSTLLPHLHITGWDPGAYGGFPLYTFYFPLPDLLAALLGFVIPFAVAFKLVTILGSLTLPVAAWAFGRLAGLERPRPAVLAVATLPFLFDQTFTIYGGNLYSTMAGEYAYSLGLSLALVFLGLVVRGLRTGRHRALAALLLFLCVLCHLVAALLALAGMVVALVLLGVTRRRSWWAATVLGTGALLSAWWAVPFAFEQPYSTNMGWTNVTTYASLLAPRADRWTLALAAVGMAVAVARRQRVMAMVAVLGALSAVALVVDPQGKLYNTRFLPLWWLGVYLMAGYALAEVGVAVATWWRYRQVPLPPWNEGTSLPLPRRLSTRHRAMVGEAGGIGAPPWAPPARAPETTPPPGAGGLPVAGMPPPPWPRRRARWRWAPGAVTVPLVSLAAAGLVVMPPLVIAPTSSFQLGPLHLTADNVPSWATWNYSGYQAKTGWKELHDGIVATMDRVSPRYGCGRAMWEYNANLDRFGTPMALMLLPYFTNNCIDSMEGLLFESASSTPYHFINQSELSAAPSDAMVGLPYKGLNVVEGVKHLQLLGVRYFLASSASVQGQAASDPDLKLVATTGPWRTPYQGTVVATTWQIYLVRNTAMVTPLMEQPSVLSGVGPQQGSLDQARAGATYADLPPSSWLSVALRWYDNPSAWAHELVAGGPSTWPRQSATAALGSTGSLLPAVAVTRIRTTTDTVRFHVDRTGVPVLVRVSYFPAWHASGALGPWRAEPNLMVVVPTSHDVTLGYGSTPSGWLGLALSVIGLVVLVGLARRGAGFSVH
jgi:hypothetical protein